MKFWKNQKLEVYLLFVFLGLIAICSTVIVTFTYERTYHSILRFSKGTVRRVSSLIVEKVECLLNALETSPTTTSGLIKRSPEISYENKVLVGHMLDEVKYRPSVYGFHVADPKGNYIQVIDLSFGIAEKYGKKIPKNAAYLVMVLDPQNKPGVETWYYYDEDERPLFSEEVKDLTYDPRIRPWYRLATEKKGPFWTEIYQFSLSDQKGIDFSLPVYDASGKLLAVIGVNLTLESFSNFLLNQKIGKTGRAFILDAKGNLILPVEKTDHQEIVAPASQAYKKRKEEDFLLSYKGEKYLVSVETFSTIFNKDWQMLIIVPYSDYFGTITKTHRQTLFLSLLILIFGWILVAFFSKKTSQPIVSLVEEVNKIKQLNFSNPVHVASHIKEIIELSSAIDSMRSALSSFTKYVPKEIVNKLIEKGKDIELNSEKREITLLFSDITGFTAFSELTGLDELSQILGAYFDGMTKAILENGGTVDKYIGDGLMAFWNAPDDEKDHAIYACLAALSCRAFLAKFNEMRKKQSRPELHTRIGINTGEMIVGNVGTKDRMNYTVIGDAVNATQRIQEKNKEFHTNIIISEETLRKTGDMFLVRPLENSELKGRKGKMQIFELLEVKKNASKELSEFAELFQKAYNSYQEGKLGEARERFEYFLKKYPEDPVAKIYLDRCLAG